MAICTNQPRQSTFNFDVERFVQLETTTQTSTSRCGAFDLCPLPSAMVDAHRLFQDVRSLQDEYERLKSAGEEQEAADEIRLHDAQLERLRLRTLLDRYSERPPKVEELAERYEAEIDQLAEEHWQLQEENALLTHRDAALDLED